MILNIASENNSLEQRYRDMQAFVSQMTDKLGEHVDAGIAETVVLLNLLGIPTSGSCEGHMTHGTGAPWIDIEDTGIGAQTEEATRLFSLAKECKLQQGHMTEEVLHLFEQAHQARLTIKKKHIAIRLRLLSLLATFYEQRRIPFERQLIIQSRSDGKSRLESQGADMQEVLEPSARQQKLADYQQEMQDFTAFLKQRYRTPVEEEVTRL